jgi:hypothetical protein
MMSDVDSLRSLSHWLMWATAVFAILAATTTGIRYYVDRRVSDLTSAARSAEAERKEKAQSEREAALRAQLETAEREQREASHKLSKLEEKTKPRAFNESQEKQFIAEVARCSNKILAITTPIGDPEAASFARYLISLFKNAGWTIKADSQAIFSGTPVGVILRVPSKEQLHPCVASVQRAFQNIGIQALGEVAAGTNMNVLDIVVGHKP